jgi:hypothetical protein
MRVWLGGLSGRIFAGWMTFDGERWVSDASKHDVTDDVNEIVFGLRGWIAPDGGPNPAPTSGEAFPDSLIRRTP